MAAVADRALAAADMAGRVLAEVEAATVKSAPVAAVLAVAAEVGEAAEEAVVEGADLSHARNCLEIKQ
jgi:hypothetical protein